MIFVPHIRILWQTDQRMQMIFILMMAKGIFIVIFIMARGRIGVLIIILTEGLHSLVKINIKVFQINFLNT